MIREAPPTDTQTPSCVTNTKFWTQTEPTVHFEPTGNGTLRIQGEDAAKAEYRVFTRTQTKLNPQGILPDAQLTKYRVGDTKSIILANNLGGTPVGLELGGHSILFSPIESGEFTGELKGAGSVGGAPEVWPAGRIYDRDFQPKIHTAAGVIDLSEEHARGLIPKETDGKELLMHGRGFTTDKWKISAPRFEAGELVISKTLDFRDDSTCAKFGPGKLEITYKLGTNPETGNDRLRTIIRASSTDSNTKAYLSSMALHYFFKAQAGDRLTSSATSMHNSQENLRRPNESHPERPASGYNSVDERYQFSQGVDVLGDKVRREAILMGFFKDPTAEGLRESARLERKDHTLVLKQKALLRGEKFPHGLLVFNAGPKGTLCLEPYFGAINAQNRVTQFGDDKPFSQPLTVGADKGDFEAVVDLEVEPKQAA